MRRVVTGRIPDQQIERVRTEHERAITELQQAPLAQAIVISNVSLADATATTVPHGLGREPLFVGISCVRGPSTSGRVEEVRSTSGVRDRKKFVTLTANGYGATVLVDVLIA